MMHSWDEGWHHWQMEVWWWPLLALALVLAVLVWRAKRTSSRAPRP